MRLFKRNVNNFEFQKSKETLYININSPKKHHNSTMALIKILAVRTGIQ